MNDGSCGWQVAGPLVSQFVISSTKWWLVTSSILQGLILDILFNIFISKLNDGIKHTLSNFADDTKLWRSGWKHWRAGLQSDLDRLEKLADRNLILFNTGKCKVLQLGWNNPMQQGRLGLTGQERLLQKRTLGSCCTTKWTWLGSMPLWPRRHTGLIC